MDAFTARDGTRVRVEVIDDHVYLSVADGAVRLASDDVTRLIGAIQVADDEANGRNGSDWYTVMVRDEKHGDGVEDTLYALIAPSLSVARRIAEVVHLGLGFTRAFGVAFTGRPSVESGTHYNTLMQDEGGWRIVGSSVVA